MYSTLLHHLKNDAMVFVIVSKQARSPARHVDTSVA